MLLRLAHRIAVRGLDVVVSRTRSSDSRALRFVGTAVDRSRRLVGLDRVPVSAPLPPWPDRVPDPPMWDSERKRLEKWYADMGYGRLGPGAVPIREDAGERAADDAGREKAGDTSPEARPRVRLDVVADRPAQSPFESDPGPSSSPVADGARLEGEALVEAVRDVLDACRPLVVADGGDIELLDVIDDVVHLRLTGNCVGCPSAQATLLQGIERRLKAALPQIRGISAPQLVPN